MRSLMRYRSSKGISLRGCATPSALWADVRFEHPGRIAGPINPGPDDATPVALGDRVGAMQIVVADPLCALRCLAAWKPTPGRSPGLEWMMLRRCCWRVGDELVFDGVLLAAAPPFPTEYANRGYTMLHDGGLKRGVN